MVFEYTYSLSDDFGGNLLASQLHQVIMDDGGITPNIITVSTKGDIVKIQFDASLSGPEITTLNGIVSAHTPTTPSKEMIFNITPIESYIDSTFWVTVASFLHNKESSVTSMNVISFMEVGGTSYDVRVVDITNNAVIASQNLANTDELNNSLGTISNLPSDNAIFELQVKINGVTVAQVKNFNY